jgi:uncharacterized NAD(P)/FAD-binding protein YdhS
MFALGPVTRGTFWEIVAVPDIRLYCGRLANHLSAAMRESVHASEPSRTPSYPAPTAGERIRPATTVPGASLDG